MKKLISVAAFSLLAGCAEYQTPIPVDVQFNEAAQSELKGYHPMPVRAFLGQTTREAEIKGAFCMVKGSGFQANITTPAAVNIPVYGLRSKAIYVECSYQGVKKDISLGPVNITERKVMSNGAAAGVLGIVISTAVVAVRKNQDRDEYGYNDITIVFKDNTSKSSNMSNNTR